MEDDRRVSVELEVIRVLCKSLRFIEHANRVDCGGRSFLMVSLSNAMVSWRYSEEAIPAN